MSRFAAWAGAWVMMAGCVAGPPGGLSWDAAPVYQDNPAWVPVRRHDVVWETVVDVVDDYFRIEREDPVRVVGNVLTEGRLDTYPMDAPTLLEPWRPDSGNSYDRLENTLQSTRRRAEVRVIPDEGGFWVDVAVFRELEDLVQPVHASAGAATFRTDGSLTRVTGGSDDPEPHVGWVPLGRDPALEQRLLAEIVARTAPPGVLVGPR